MRLVFGFLATVILLLSMVNHAHTDTAHEDAEMIQTGMMAASKAESSSPELAHQDSTQGDRGIEVLAERVDNRVDNTEAIDHSQGKKRRVFIGVSIESGASTLSAANRRNYNYSYGYGPIIGWSLEIGRGPFAIELGREKIFNRTPREKIDVFSRRGPDTIGQTGMYVSFIRLKSRIVRLKQLHIWIGIGIDRSITKNKWDSRKGWFRTNESGIHLQGSFSVKKWRTSELSINIRYRSVEDVVVFYSGSYAAPRFHETRSVSVKWTRLLYESSH